MRTELGVIPFDHFQRYATAAMVIRALGDGVRSILEVGANRQRLLGALLPERSVLYTDRAPAELDMHDFVVADATALPFADASHDAVVSLDVLEHISPQSRVVAIREMARVAARIVVVGCPAEQAWVRQAEQEAHDVWLRFFDRPYPWLAEHAEFGLVDPAATVAAFEAAGMRCIRLPHGDAGLWSKLMAMHFIKEAVPEAAPLVESIDRFYNRHVFAGDSGDTCYREFFLACRSTADEERLRAFLASRPVRSLESACFLEGIASGLIRVTERLQRSEREWKLTAESHREAEARAIEQFRRAENADAATLREASRASAAEQRAEREASRASAAEQRAECEASRADDAERRAQDEAARAKQAESRCLELQQQLEREGARAEALQADVVSLGSALHAMHIQALAWRRRAGWAAALAGALAAVLGWYLIWGSAA